MSEVKESRETCCVGEGFFVRASIEVNGIRDEKKELELEIQLFDENGVLNLEYRMEALDIKDYNSDDDAALSIRRQSPFKWKEFRNKKLFSWLDRSDKPENAYNHNYEGSENDPENAYLRVTFEEDWSCKPRSSSRERRFNFFRR